MAPSPTKTATVTVSPPAASTAASPDERKKVLPSASSRKGFLLPQQTPAVQRNVRERILTRGM